MLFTYKRKLNDLLLWVSYATFYKMLTVKINR